MANVGSAAAGKTLIGAGNGASPTYASIGTNSGLTSHGLVIGQGNGAFTSTSSGTLGQILTSNGSGSDPTFQNAPASGIMTINGDSGSITGTSVTLYAHQSTNTCGQTIKFVNSGTVSTLNVTDSNDNTTFGASAGKSGQSGSGNVGFGSLALGSLQNGSQNSSFGRATNYFLTTGSNNSCFGYSACESLVTGSRNCCFGVGAGGSYNGAESDNIIIGQNSGVVGESAVTRIGVQGTQTTCFIAGITGVTASNPVLTTINSSTGQLGNVSSVNNAILNTNGSGVPTLATSPACSGTLTAGTGLVTTTGDVTVTAGNLLLPATSSTAGIVKINTANILHAYGLQNIFLGSFSGNFTTSATYSVGLGYGTLNNITNGGQNVAVGGNAGNAITSGVGNLCVGYLSGAAITTTGDNCFLGFKSGQSTTGQNNVSLGSQSLFGFGGGGAANNNTIVGFAGGYRISTGTDNTIVGYNVAPFISTGSFNTAIGDSALPSLTTGSHNTTLGYNSGSGYTGSESSNICIKAAGTASESNVLRIGTAGSGNGQVSTCYIAGINGVTVTGTAVLCSTAGQLGTIASSIRYKENIQPISEEVSVLGLNVKSFNYKNDETKKTQYGLIAEEIHKDFPYLCFYNEENQPESVKYHELCTFLLVEVQRLNDRIKKLESR